MKHWWTASRRWRSIVPLLGICIALGPGSVRTLSGARACCEGDDWLSWSPDVRETYVRGFIDGFEWGAIRTCQAYTAKYDSGQGGSKGSQSETCRRLAPVFSETKGMSYMDAITEFYKKYPAGRWLFAREILMDLADPPGLSIDQIHAQIKERHHP